MSLHKGKIGSRAKLVEDGYKYENFQLCSDCEMVTKYSAMLLHILGTFLFYLCNNSNQSLFSVHQHSSGPLGNVKNIRLYPQFLASPSGPMKTIQV